jgi:hypothetical protein
MISGTSRRLGPYSLCQRPVDGAWHACAVSAGQMGKRQLADQAFEIAIPQGFVPPPKISPIVVVVAFVCSDLAVVGLPLTSG